MNNKKRKLEETEFITDKDKAEEWIAKQQDKEQIELLKPIRKQIFEENKHKVSSISMVCKFTCQKIFDNINERKNHYYIQCPLSRYAQYRKKKSKKFYHSQKKQKQEELLQLHPIKKETLLKRLVREKEEREEKEKLLAKNV